MPDAKEGLLDDMSSRMHTLTNRHIHTFIIYLFFRAYWHHSCNVRRNTRVKHNTGGDKRIKKRPTIQSQTKRKSDATEEQVEREAGVCNFQTGSNRMFPQSGGKRKICETLRGVCAHVKCLSIAGSTFHSQELEVGGWVSPVGGCEFLKVSSLKMH